jgi:hypothetical protein
MCRNQFRLKPPKSFVREVLNLKAPAHSDPFEGSTIHSTRHTGG